MSDESQPNLDMEKVKTAILEFIETNPGTTVKEIRAQLADEFPGLRKKDANKILYALEGEIVQREGELSEGAPKWQLKNTTVGA